MGMIDEFVNALKPEDEGAPGKTYSATVAKVDDEGIVWVYLAGSDKETPTSSTSAEIKRGDAVNVEWRNNKLYIAGNYSNPSAGTERVGRVEGTAKKAEETANNAESVAQSAQESAAAAHQIAADTEQHFWFTETGADTGAHITEVTQEEWNDSNSPNYHSGGNLLARSNGIAVRDGMTELSQFGANGTQIGQNGQTRILQDYHSLQMIDKEDRTYFHVSDLRGDDGYATLTKRGVIESSTDTFLVDFPIRSKDTTTVTVNNTEVPILSASGTVVILQSSVPAGSNVVITYQTNTPIKAYTLGYRLNNSDIGAYSIVEGVNCVARNYDHAEGSNTKATGVYSHSQNLGTIAAGLAQTALGTYNIEDTDQKYAVIIGNGDAVSRSNALTVDWNGDVEASGGMTLYNHAGPIGEDLSISGTNNSFASSATATQLKNTADNAKAELSLSAGKWVVIGSARFAASTSGVRYVNFRYTNSDNSHTSIAASIMTTNALSASTWETRLNTSWIVAFSETSTIELYAAQTSNSALNTSWNLRAIRIR